MIKRKSGTVYIWLPNQKEKRVGHVSMQINSEPVEENYVSWWPESESKKSISAPVSKILVSETSSIFDSSVKRKIYNPSTFEIDMDSERGGPNMIYTLNPDFFSKVLMMIAWCDIKNKDNCHYKFLSKNCSTIVARVLYAGLKYEKKHQKIFSFLTHGYAIATPVDIALKMEHIAKIGLATKSEGSFLMKKKMIYMRTLFNILTPSESP